MIEPNQKNRKFNEWRTQVKFSTNKDLKGDMADGIKHNNDIDYFLVGIMPAGMERSAKLTRPVHQEFTGGFFRHSVLQGHSLLQVKDDLKLCQAPPLFVAYVLRDLF